MASSAATTVEKYLAELPPERAEVIQSVRELVLAALPNGIVESMNGMIVYEIPLERYPIRRWPVVRRPRWPAMMTSFAIRPSRRVPPSSLCFSSVDA
jgi:hypothetical protein